MEALHSRLTTGEQSGGQEHRQQGSPRQARQSKAAIQTNQQHQAAPPKLHGTPQQPKQLRRNHPERKRLRHQRQSVDSETPEEHKDKTRKSTAESSSSVEVPPSLSGDGPQTKPEGQEETPKQKRERKPQRPGKYVCTYCGRACAKPSVLQKHIRSHTGERPYPCPPCGFSFKTKSNLYKHRKSHTHRVKAGLAIGEPRSLEEQATESEDEARQLSSALSKTEKQSHVASAKNLESEPGKGWTGGNEDSFAVKKRLAMRLSRAKQGAQAASDEKSSSLILGSKGSTESGYFSRSESTDQSQDNPPDTSAKSYAEIILGKYGRFGHLHRMPRQHNQQPADQESRSIPFTVPKKQVIDHITKLITINEAVVDTSKIDSVKPRRFSLARKNSSEMQRGPAVKAPSTQVAKSGDLAFKNSGSITMGVPCEKFHHSSLNVEHAASQTPLVRSQSMPTTQSAPHTAGSCPDKFRPCQSFDGENSSERPAFRRYGMLRRQPAIEIPLGAETSKEERDGSPSFLPDRVTIVPERKQIQPQPYECEACGTGCKDWDGYKKHKQSHCVARCPKGDVVGSQMDSAQIPQRSGALQMRKRRKEESFEFDDPASPATAPGQCKDESNVTYGTTRRPALQTCSVIQHTSSFERQESLCGDNQGNEAAKSSFAPLEEYQVLPPQESPPESTKLTNRRLVRQHSVQVPEILVTEDSNASSGFTTESASTVKHPEKPDEFQWPQRSPSLSQLPIEKLPPKKKRLRLAEASQSSGESSFDSTSLPHSPGQDSAASFASSRSTSFEESSRQDVEMALSLATLRKSRAPHMLTVPGVHHHREMRRSASEQAPHDLPPSAVMAENRSKSFDYSCLSPERSAVGWRERRKCLLIRHSAVVDPDEEREQQANIQGRSPEQVGSATASQTSPPPVYSGRPHDSLSVETALPTSTVKLQSNQIFSQWKLSRNIELSGRRDLSNARCTSLEPVKGNNRVQHQQATQSFPSPGPSGAARAHYHSMSTGLKLQIPSLSADHPEVQRSPPDVGCSDLLISSSQEIVRPVTSPAVAVRLQTDTLTLACAIYTTLSAHKDHRNTTADLQLWSDGNAKIPSSGGNKRMLSPSNSVELPLESRQQQKRVKEEERETGCVESAPGDAGNQGHTEDQSCLPSVCTSISHVHTPSFPSLLPSTCNSWCYLNYTKPNPATLDEQKPSVYSSWCTSSYDPNPPGLSSKAALSLLHCKQRLSPTIYTVSPISARTQTMEAEDKRPCSTEVLHACIVSIGNEFYFEFYSKSTVTGDLAQSK